MCWRKDLWPKQRLGMWPFSLVNTYAADSVYTAHCRPVIYQHIIHIPVWAKFFLMLCQRSLIRVPGFCHNKGLRIAGPFCDVCCITTVVVKLAMKVESPCLGYLKASLRFHWIIQECLQLDRVTTRTPNIHLLWPALWLALWLWDSILSIPFKASHAVCHQGQEWSIPSLYPLL